MAGEISNPIPAQPPGFLLKRLLVLFLIPIVPMVLSCAGTKDSGKSSMTPAGCLRDPGCKRVMVAAHRGYHTGSFPENSLAAFRAAAELGVDLIEVDVRHTADDHLVLMHNSSVDATTDGTGEVSDLTLEEIQKLTLKGADPNNPETQHVPLFSQALALAREYSIMLYVDKKTERWDLVLAEIKKGDYFDQALVRDSSSSVLGEMSAKEPRLMVMPSIGSSLGIDKLKEDLPGLCIVEVSHDGPWPAMNQALKAAGLKIQQDVLGYGDDQAETGDYSAWKDYIDKGVNLLQTDWPQFLCPAVKEYNKTGKFPENGPGVH
ncbi:MAG: glycerophosphodiester phosphodiesterase family protein [Deltaproteobacteria bacterium]|nr:glycerophosphodiester phosphodiesterase family protein [Deltaproteobacteria bacterium]